MSNDHDDKWRGRHSAKPLLSAIAALVVFIGNPAAISPGYATPPPSGATSTGTSPSKPNCTNYHTSIQQSPHGGYWTDGYINNTKVALHIDTGADMVAVPLAIARSAGLEVGQRGQAQTASDTITMYRTIIPVLRVGSLVFKNVKAAINPSAPDTEVLLGMSALESVSLHQEQGVMVLATEICNQPSSDGQPAVAPSPGEPPLVLKRSVRDCMGPNHAVDAKVIECMKSK